MSKKLGQVDLCGIDYDVILSDDEEHPELSDCYGYCKAGKIVIDENLCSSLAFRATLIHEIQHGIWEHSGLLDMVASKLGCSRTDQKVLEFEELFIRIFTPHLIKALASSRKLKF